jgi:hypothetical protein
MFDDSTLLNFKGITDRFNYHQIIINLHFVHIELKSSINFKWMSLPDKRLSALFLKTDPCVTVTINYIMGDMVAGRNTPSGIAGISC